MRILAGQYKGRSLVMPKNKGLRPTQDKVRQAVFNILATRIINATFLDLCCGTGSMSFEALSHGAALAVAVDRDITEIKRNRAQFTEEMPLKMIRSDVTDFLKRTAESFDVIFLDPPWDDAALYTDSLMAIAKFGILKPDGMVICEHQKKERLSVPQDLKIAAEKKYGDTVLTLLGHNPPREENKK